jgi:hypothetical protein
MRAVLAGDIGKWDRLVRTRTSRSRSERRPLERIPIGLNQTECPPLTASDMGSADAGQARSRLCPNPLQRRLQALG